MKFDLAITARVLAIVLVLGIWPVPAHAQTYPSTGPISGYMDFHFNNEEGADPRLDFHRFVLLVNHSLSPRIRLAGELELAHALVEGLEAHGEVDLEQPH